MKKVILFSLFSFSLMATEVSDLLPKSITFKSLKKTEEKMKKWVDSVGEKDLIKISDMNQRPDEIHLIEFLYPHLLPDGYNGKKIYSNCFHFYTQLEKSKSKESFEKWEHCVRYDYRKPEPHMLRVLKELKKDLK